MSLLTIIFVILLLHLPIWIVFCKDIKKSVKSNGPGKQVVFTYIGQCLGKDDLQIMVHPWDITREGKNNYFVGGNNVSIREDIVNGFDIKFSLLKCEDLANSETCSYLVNEEDTIATNVYDFVRLPLFTKILNRIKPPICCPIKKGVFFVEKIAVDDTFLTLTAGRQSFYWKINIVGNDKYAAQVMCLNIDFHTRQRRNGHTWKPQDEDNYKNTTSLR